MEKFSSHSYNLRISQKYLDKIKCNSSNTTETNTTRSSTQSDLETRGLRDLKVLLSIFRPLTPAQSGSELLPHPKAQVCIPYASAAPTKLPKRPQCALQQHTASYTLRYSSGNKIQTQYSQQFHPSKMKRELSFLFQN